MTAKNVIPCVAVETRPNYLSSVFVNDCNGMLALANVDSACYHFLTFPAWGHGPVFQMSEAYQYWQQIIARPEDRLKSSGPQIKL